MKRDIPSKWVICATFSGSTQFFARLYRDHDRAGVNFEYVQYIEDAFKFDQENVARAVFNLLHDGLDRTPNLKLFRIIEHSGYTLEPVTVYEEDHR